MFNLILGFLVLVAIAALFGWIAFRAWKAPNQILKWGGVVLGGFLALVVGLVSVLALVGITRFNATHDVPVPDLVVAGTPEQVARGEYLANSFCTSCHSLDGELPLAGGVDLAGDLSIPLGSFVSQNLTPAGPLQEWSDGEIFRALRNGIGRDGRKLVFMSTVRARNMSDEDIQAVIAYLRSQPAVENETQDPSDQPNLLAAVLLGASMLPEGSPPTAAVISAPPKDLNHAYGEYIISYQDCRDCHGEDLKGGVEGQLAPIGPSLLAVRGWTQEQFISAMRTGITPSGHTLAGTMPWKAIGRMDDIDLAAMYLYIASIP